MKRLLLETSFSKIYMIGMIIITLLVVGGYFSYAMFTVSKEKSNAISIVTGNLTYKLEVDGVEGNKLTVGDGETKEFTVTLSNPNNREARFNFYYVGSLPSGVEAGYKTGDGINIPMEAVGSNLTASGSAGSSNTYKIRVKNSSSSSVTVTLGVCVGLDYNDLSLPSNGHLFEEIVINVGTVLLDNLTSGDTFDDGVDTFITGEDPNNYIWYSGKLWRAVSVNNEAKTTKLVTDEAISSISFSSGNSTFEDSYMKEWLNDTSVDGFLGNLRDVEYFIDDKSVWNVTEENRSLGSITRPNGTNTVISPVGLLNAYEYQSSYQGDSYLNSYLNNTYFWLITPFSSTKLNAVSYMGSLVQFSANDSASIRPSINLLSIVKIVDGNGTADDPYRLYGDNDKDLKGVKLDTRYSGEYIRFGVGENNLYRIVSQERGTKITSAVPLKDGNIFKTSYFGTNVKYSTTDILGKFLNGEYLTNYLSEENRSMVSVNNIWYLGTVGEGVSYKFAKYIDTSMTGYATSTNAKVGLLRYGELMAGPFEDYIRGGTFFWLITPFSGSDINAVDKSGSIFELRPNNYDELAIRPAMHLSTDVVITGGTGLKNDPFTLELSS